MSVLNRILAHGKSDKVRTVFRIGYREFSLLKEMSFKLNISMSELIIRWIDGLDTKTIIKLTTEDNNLVQINIIVTNDTLKKLSDVSKNLNISNSEVVRQVVKQNVLKR